MGEPNLKRDVTIREACLEFKVSERFIRNNIRCGVIEVACFNGKPLRPYRLIYKSLCDLFTVARKGSLKIEDLGKSLGRKPSTKEELWP